MGSFRSSSMLLISLPESDAESTIEDILTLATVLMVESLISFLYGNIRVEYMTNAPYWTAVIVGLVIIVVIFIIMKRKEKTQADSIEKFVGEVVAPTIEKYFEGDSSVIPFNDKLYIYLSTFSGLLSDHATAVYSGSGVPMWRSLVNEDVTFHVIGTNLPTSIEKGLPMKGTRLVGPPSEDAAYPNTAFVLPSFTVAWYANWKSLDFETDAPIILFRMFAENPNHVQISLREKDSTNVYLDAVIGNAANVYSWEIPKTTLLTQGAGTLYAFVYNREEKKITFNIGSSIKYPRVLPEAPTVKLGNTAMDINYNQNWDAELKAFMFYRAAISDFSTVFDYLGEQASGKMLVMSAVDTEKAELEETLKSCSLNDTELAALRDELNLTREQLYNIRLKLRACMQQPEDIDPNSFRRWEIKDGLLPGKYDNLNQCKELNVNNLDEIKSNLARTLVAMFAKPLQTAVSSGGSTSATTTKTSYPPTLHTTFPNAGFKKNLSSNSIYVATPYPQPIASQTSTSSKTGTEWKLNTINTQFGGKEPIAQAVSTATSLTSSTTSAATTSTSGAIPEASLLPRPESSDAGVKLLYADPSKTDTSSGTQITSSIAYPSRITTTSATTAPTVSASVTASTEVSKDSLWSTLKSLFA